MKKIAAIALIASSASTASAKSSRMDEIRPAPTVRHYCLQMNLDEQGNVTLEPPCDATNLNQFRKFHSPSFELAENGCADGQAALTIEKVEIPSCPVPFTL